MKQIPLTQGKVALVDDSDYEELMKHKWWFSKMKGYCIGYAIRSITVSGKKKTILMHRQILNATESLDCDHIDGNGLNNCRSNLRLCTHTENLRNMHTHKSNLLGVRGVSLHSNGKCFMARIWVNYAQIYLGIFSTLEEAKEARAKAEIEYFGEFRRKAVDSITA